VAGLAEVVSVVQAITTSMAATATQPWGPIQDPAAAVATEIQHRAAAKLLKS